MIEHNSCSKSLNHLEDTVKFLASNQSDLSSKVDFLITQIANLTTQKTPTSFLHHKSFMKLDVPSFNGFNTMGWIFKITQFFDYHQTP